MGRELTPSQLRMWFLHTLDPRRTDLTIACAARLTERMDLAGLQRRLEPVVHGHDRLAMVVTDGDGGLSWRQVPADRALDDAVLPSVRVSSEQQVQSLYGQFVDRPWDLVGAPAWAVQLVTADDATYLFCAFHHIVCDGDRSLRLFLEGLTQGEPDGLEPTESVAEPAEPVHGDAVVGRLADALTSPGDLRQRILGPVRGRRVRHWDGVLEETGQGTREPADEPDAVNLLERLSAAVHPLVGEAEQLIVAIPFDGTAAARSGQIDYAGNPGIAVLPPPGAQGPRWAAREYERAQELAAVPFQQVMADERFRRSVHTDRPFDILLVPRTLFTHSSSLIHSVTEPTRSRTPYALVVNHWRDIEGRLRVALESAVFEDETLAHLGRRLTAPTAAVASAATRVAAPPNPAEDGTGAVRDVDFVSRIEAVVRNDPHRAAVEAPGTEPVSYGELWEAATVLAGDLAAHLPTGRRTVAVLGDKHPNELVCALGIHIAGGTVLRLDRDAAAVRRVLEAVPKVGAVIRLDSGPICAGRDAAAEVTGVDVRAERTLRGPFGDYRVAVTVPEGPEPAAEGTVPTLYLTMTSGSTGQPKPVPFPRDDFNSLISWHLAAFPSPRRMLQFSKLSFDIAYHEIYATWCGGGTLVAVDAASREDPKALLGSIGSAGIQKVYLPTVLLRPLAETAMADVRPVPTPQLREVIVAGGSLEITDVVREWFTHTGAHLFNHYGMSETQDVTSHLLAGDPSGWPDRPSVGLPIDGADVRIVSDLGTDLPPLLSGSVVVRTRTAERQTGDLGYRDRDGRLHILGRGDRVIKRRGFRVNLQALEAQVARADGVEDAVAISYTSSYDTREVAVVATLRRGNVLDDPSGLRARVAASLGEGYEFDLHIVESLPRLPNAKPDLLALARLAREGSRVPPCPAEAGELAPHECGSTVLDAVRRLVPGAPADEGVRFLDVGLDSLSLMSLAAALQGDHPGLSVADFFQYPTIGGLQRHLDGGTGEHVADIPRHGITVAADGTRGQDAATRAVAVVGLAGRFPGAPDADTFWQNLLDGDCALGPAPEDRDGAAQGGAPAAFVPVHGNLTGVDEFDHSFFGISPAEARRMDPQARIFLQLCWTALENAGEAGGAGEQDGKSIGIFAGAGLSTYLLNEVEPHRLHAADGVPFLEYNTLHERLGSDRNFLTSTASYRLGLTGPSVTVQTACATSLTAVHMARQALLNGECDLAIAGGVSVIYPQPEGYAYVDGSVRSGRGACRPFDRNADGTVFGNGAGVVVLKRTDDARTDRNTVVAEIVGGAINHDGAVKGSFTAPNPAAQTRVIDAALRSTGVEDLPLSFIEAHGTGTSVGDAIEWSALLTSRINAFEAGADRPAQDGPGVCTIGSVKGNVGHLDEAAGIAGLIKACLSVRHRIHPGTHGFTELHPQLAESERFTVSAKNTELPQDGPVYGAVSAFGMGGANCHLILRSPDPVRQHGGGVRTAPLYLPVSGQTPQALAAAAELLETHLDHHGERLSTPDTVRTLAHGRRHFTLHRGVLHRGATGGHLVTVGGAGRGDGATGRRTELAWVFPGQGSGFSWPVVSELAHWPLFDREFRRFLRAFRERLGADVFDEHVGFDGGALTDPRATATPPTCAERCTVREQVLQFSFQRSLAGLLESFGIVPDVVVGHSLGEISAAVSAGLISEASALALVAHRARLMEAAPADGFMVQLRCDLDRAVRLAEKFDLDIAAVNGPRQIVLAGERAREGDLLRAVERADIPAVRLDVAGAFHSRMMTGAAEALARLDLEVRAGPSGAPSAAFISTHRQHPVGAGPSELAYWTSQLTSPVEYAVACEELLSRQDHAVVVELGSGSVLTKTLRAVATAHARPVPVLVGGAKSAPDYVATVVAAAYQAGTPIDWAEVNQVSGGTLIPLPAYPFDRTEVPSLGAGPSSRRERPLARPLTTAVDPEVPREPDGAQTPGREITFELSPGEEDWIREHRVEGRCVVPAAGILALFARACRLLDMSGSGIPLSDVSLSDISFERPVIFESEADRMAAEVSVSATTPCELVLFTRPLHATEAEWTRNASALLADTAPCSAAAGPPPRITDATARRMPSDQLYSRFRAQRLDYGDSYRNLGDVISGDLDGGGRAATASWACGAPPVPRHGRTVPETGRMTVESRHVAAIDAVLQVGDVLDGAAGPAIRMPAHIAHARLRSEVSTGTRQRIQLCALPGGDSAAHAQLTGALIDERSGVVADLSGIRYQALEPSEPVAHRLRWCEHVEVGAGLPTAVTSELADLARQLSAPDPDVTQYQQQIRHLETYAVRALEGAGGADWAARVGGGGTRTAGADPGERRVTAVSGRRARAFASLLDRRTSPSAGPAADEPARAPGGKVAAEWEILQSSARELPRYFDGSSDGETILFSGTGTQALRSYYQGSFLLGRLNGALRRTVAAVAAAQAPRRVKILEVGGGTGASTEGVLAALLEQGAAVDYTFTDVSEGLIRLARDRFGHHSGFRASAVDLDSDASVATLDDDYDIVVAVDVIHATRDIGRTLDRLADRLAPSGVVLMVEDLKQLAWVDLTFGLLDSWWSFDDPHRQDHPLLDMDDWHSVLAARFGSVDVVRACGALPIEETAAEEGLFVCGQPRRCAPSADRSADEATQRTGYAVADLVPGEHPEALLDRIAAVLPAPSASAATTLVLGFDAGSCGILEPAEAEWFTDALLRVLRLVEEHPRVASVVIRTSDAVEVDGSPRVLTAGAMAAALARVTASEDRRVTALSLALTAPPRSVGELDRAVTAFLAHRGAWVNGAIVGGSLYVPRVEVLTAAPPAADALDHDVAVLFGGGSDLAHATADWLVSACGVPSIVLVGRSAPDEASQRCLARLHENGAEARWLTADLGELPQVREVARTVAADAARPLVVNLAAVFRDATVDSVTGEGIQAVLRPKVRGSRHIDLAFHELPCTTVLFSSTSTLLGNAGQATHAMACAYMDGLADARAQGGPRTLSVQWGPWEDVGITARRGLNERLRRDGEPPSPSAVFLPELGRAVQGPSGSAVAADLSAPALRQRSFLAAMLPQVTGPTGGTAVTAPDRSSAGSRAHGAETPTAPGDVVVETVAEVLGVPSSAVVVEQPLADNGVDSLALIEVRTLIERRAGIRIPLNQLSDAPSLAAVRELVAPAAAEAQVSRDVPRSQGDEAPGPAVFYVAGIFGRADGAPDLEAVLGGAADFVTLSAPTRPAGTPGRLEAVEVAKDLADQIERVRPEGPLTLVGHSFGAMLAYSCGIELRCRGRELTQLVLIDGEPIGSPAAIGSREEFDALLRMSAGGSTSVRGRLSADSRAAAFDSYRVNCAIARSPQAVGAVGCPILLVVPHERAHAEVGLSPERTAELRRMAREELGGTSVDVAHVPGDHFSMLRSPHVEHLITHITAVNPKSEETK